MEGLLQSAMSGEKIDMAKPTLDLSDLMAEPSGDWSKRNDGTQKGMGFLGPLKTPSGDVATEYTIGVDIDGKQIDIPTLVPTLTRAEVEEVLRAAGDRSGQTPLSDIIMDKAEDHARKRLSEGLGVFADDPEQSFVDGFNKIRKQ